MADPVRFVCANREINSSGSPSHPHVATLRFKSVNKRHVDPHFLCGGRGSTMVGVWTQCSDGSSGNPQETRRIFVHGCFENRLSIGTP